MSGFYLKTQLINPSRAAIAVTVHGGSCVQTGRDRMTTCLRWLISGI